MSDVAPKSSDVTPSFSDETSNLDDVTPNFSDVASNLDDEAPKSDDVASNFDNETPNSCFKDSKLEVNDLNSAAREWASDCWSSLIKIRIQITTDYTIVPAEHGRTGEST